MTLRLTLPLLALPLLALLLEPADNPFSLFLFINAFDDPILGGRTPPFERISPSTFVSGSITGLGGHLGWLDGEGIKTRWVLKPVKKILTTAKRDLSVQAKNIDAVKGGERCPAKEVDGIVEDWR